MTLAERSDGSNDLQQPVREAVAAECHFNTSVFPCGPTSRILSPDFDTFYSVVSTSFVLFVRSSLCSVPKLCGPAILLGVG